MKKFLSIFISTALAVSGYAQTRNVLVGTNNAVVQPTNFWSADASNARAGLGLGTAATNPASAFQPASSVLSNLVSGGSLTFTNITVGISNVTGLQSALDGKLGTNPTLLIANISNLQTTLDGKLGTNPTLQISNINALQTALDGKLSGAFPIAISNVSGLQTSLDGKLSTNPTLSISNISGLQTNLDTKLSITGNAANLTNFPASLLRTTGDASGLTNFPTLNQATTGTASNVTGIVAVVNGGTGTNSAIGARQNLGLVWTGLTNTNAETFRVGLGATTVGSSLFTLANPSSIRFIRINSDNTVSALSGSDFRTAIGLGTAATNLATAFQSSSSVLTNLAANNGSSLTNISAAGVVGVLATNGNGAGITNITAANITGTVALASNVTGTIAISNGGSGATTAGGARTNLGLGATWLTNTVASNFLSAIGLGISNNVQFAEVIAPSLGVGLGTNSYFSANSEFVETALPIEFASGSAAGTRTNLGLGAAWLTNTNVTNFRTSIGLGLTNNVTFNSVAVGGGDLRFSNDSIYWAGSLRYSPEDQSFEGSIGINDGYLHFIGTNSAVNVATTRTNLGLGWPALTNSNAGTGLVSVNTNGDVVSPTNFWQRAPIQTLVQDFTGITVSQTNNATNARNVYVYSLATNVSAISNTIILPTNTATFNGDELTVVHRGTTNTKTVIRQAGATNNLITLSRFDESVKFIRELGQWDFYHNISFVEPIQFSGTNTAANAAASRTNLGLGAVDVPTFDGLNIGSDIDVTVYGIIGYGSEIDLEERDLKGGGAGYDWNLGGSGFYNVGAISFANPTNAATTRTNLGLGASNNVSFGTVTIGNNEVRISPDISGGPAIGWGGNNVRVVFSSLGMTLNDNGAALNFGGANTNGAAITRTNLGLGETNIVTFAGLTNNGNVTINGNAATNGLLFIYRTNNEAFLGMANLIASNNTTINNETLFRVGVAEATNRSAQFGFRSTNTNGNGVAVFSVFGYNALMMIGPSDPAAGTNPIEATVYSVNPTNKVMTLIKTNTGATMFHRPIEFENTTNSAVTRTNLGLPLAALTNSNTTNFQAAVFQTNTAPVSAAQFGDRAAWMEVNVITNGSNVSFRIPLYK